MVVSTTLALLHSAHTTHTVIAVQLGSQFYGTFDFTAKPFDWGKGYKRPEVGVLCSTPRIKKTRRFDMQ
jgi:hypothetical protein